MKRIVVLGGGESGAGAAVLAKVKGFDVFLSDMSPLKDKYRELLQKYEIPFEEGHAHTEELVLNADEVVKSPGIPLEAPLIKKLLAQGTPVISEIEFAGRYTDAKMVCITGSNGKTTTTMMTYHLFQKAGLNVGLAGNVGKSLALQVATEKFDYYVIELSSFQLDNMYDFRANVAVIMNITPDHMDRYDHKMQNYIDAKLRIVQNMQTEDNVIYWTGDKTVVKEIQQRVDGTPAPLIAQLNPFDETTLDALGITERPLPGPHNLYNTTAASLCALKCGISKEQINEALKTFKGVEHRLEKCGVIDGVEYINDSKATNVDSCYYAMMSMTKPTVLILGGKDKGNDYTQIEKLVADKCTALVYMGLHNEKLHDFFDKMGKPVADALSMREALEKCRAFAKTGDVVLLSPCCASFDLFKSYEDRGDQMKAIVAEWSAGKE